ncbi:tetratricopeptide repeat protein [Candidatus Electronema sp. TJ]|uniref:tetratricopeptide repeat protein n=1 Tax=Candidatus Electronema sp. TJ TaxID=3401573 RepID=UPI003AA94B4A
MKKSFFPAAALFFLSLLLLSYANHFDNNFQFDDYHTIVNNTHIRSISNIFNFFTEIETYGTNPDNRTYNPILVTLNAIDYWIGSGLKPRVFHISIFVSYLVLWVLLYLFYKKIFDLSLEDRWNDWFALFATVFFMQHAANAETINYIIMRSDSFSTLMIVTSFILYFDQQSRQLHLHYLTFLLGLGTKATGFIFAPLLAAYILLFEEKMPLWGPLLIRKNFGSTLSFIKKSAPVLIVAVFIFYLERAMFKQGNPLPSGGDGASRSLQYFMTQWQVIAHYIGNFILPVRLSVDKDFTLVSSMWETKTLLSLLLLLSLAVAAICASRKQETRPISFGIIWFFFALAPTSSFIPFGQIANDHRTFFPYIGLVMALGWFFALKIMVVRNCNPTGRIAIPAVAMFMAIIGLHAFGTYQRNIVWGSAESLWGDAAVKSPNNARVQLNYGLALMEKGKYDQALIHYNKALEMSPNWSYVHINMAILKNVMGQPEEAEQHFKTALANHPMNPSAYYYYAVFLNKKSRHQEAAELIKRGMQVSPNYGGFHAVQQDIQRTATKMTEELVSYERELDKNPRMEDYISLSLSYYKAGEYKRCISVCEKALQLEPDNAIAYNNICSAYNAMAEWTKAQEACRKALEFDPNYELAINNLRVAVEGSAESKQ